MALNVFFINSCGSQKFITNDIEIIVLAWILDNTFVDKLKYDIQMHLPLTELGKLKLKNFIAKIMGKICTIY